ncbi:hypothetical protein L2E82_48450 [Cichorium intybus]|uniref:Uncharacterized protein n=1 Tax=Cichorium intybus TaxID=13427 RepID=A0ACB8YY78_CICIN|nr:hypothetical protein L2E82_48450 [Cichorium intybus]
MCRRISVEIKVFLSIWSIEEGFKISDEGSLQLEMAIRSIKDGEHTYSGSACQKEDQDASDLARMIAPTERGPQPQKDTTGNQEANSRLSITAEIQQMV